KGLNKEEIARDLPWHLLETPPEAYRRVTIIARHFALGRPKDDVNSLLREVGEGKSLPAIEAILAGLADGWQKGHVVALRPETEKALATLLPKLSASGKANLIKLMTAIGSKAVQKHSAEVVKGLLATVAKDDASESVRAEAAKQVVELMSDDK